jgi:uncharacterized protein YqgC (DUF456 family)
VVVGADGWWLEILVGLACVVGIIGTIVPVLPGAILCSAAIVMWAVFTGGHAWWFAGAAVMIVGAALVLKYLIPGKRMKEQGVPGWILLVGAACGILGFFLIPIVGIFVGFVVGIYLAELCRLGSVSDAWPTTVTAMKAAGLSALIDFSSAVFATSVWVSGVATLALVT